MTESIRVRYAPSPTGNPHIGNIRTALFNWLFARQHSGKMIIRIEDTDQARQVPKAVENILESLRWLNIVWDEGPDVGGPFGPYFQSERLALYQDSATVLMNQGHAYRCFCSSERLSEMRNAQQLRKEQVGYDRRCLNLTEKDRQSLGRRSEPSVVRFRMPDSEEIEVQDLIRGLVKWQSPLLDDFVIVKSDGFPTYHLANVVDDHNMEISHVLRAEEWLSSTPRHLMIYRALEIQPPKFGHLPMILGPDRSKLSKRHGATSTLDYRTGGYLPEALANFMALLGWSLDDKTDVMDMRTLIDSFSLERIVKSGAVFDHGKLDWMNGIYIRGLSYDDLANRLIDYWRLFPSGNLPDQIDKCYLIRIVPLIQERIKTLKEASERTHLFFKETLHHKVPELVQKGMDEKGSLAALRLVETALTSADDFRADQIEGLLRGLGNDLDLSTRQLFGLIRVATTASSVSPPLPQTMEVLGKQRCLARIGSAVSTIESALGQSTLE